MSYGRLRDACQTDVDGTSIDTMEDVANQLGLDAEQIVHSRRSPAAPEAATPPRDRRRAAAERLDALRRGLAPAWPVGAGDGPKRRPPMDESEATARGALPPSNDRAGERMAGMGGNRGVPGPR